MTDRVIPLLFANEKKSLTLEQLNNAYGKKGKTFKYKQDAKKHQIKNGFKYVTRVINYDSRDILRIKGIENDVVRIKENAKPDTIAWLVN